MSDLQVSVRIETVAERIEGWAKAVLSGQFDGDWGRTFTAQELDRLEAAGVALVGACRRRRAAIREAWWQEATE